MTTIILLLCGWFALSILSACWLAMRADHQSPNARGSYVSNHNANRITRDNREAKSARVPLLKMSQHIWN